MSAWAPGYIHLIGAQGAGGSSAVGLQLVVGLHAVKGHQVLVELFPLLVAASTGIPLASTVVSSYQPLVAGQEQRRQVFSEFTVSSTWTRRTHFTVGGVLWTPKAYHRSGGSARFRNSPLLATSAGSPDQFRTPSLRARSPSCSRPIIGATLLVRAGPPFPLLGELNKATSVGPLKSPRLHLAVQSRTRSPSTRAALPLRCRGASFLHLFLREDHTGVPGTLPHLLILRPRPAPPRSARRLTQPAWLTSTGVGHSRRGFPGLITILPLFSRASRSLPSGSTTPATPSSQPLPRDFSPNGRCARRLTSSSTTAVRSTLPL